MSNTPVQPETLSEYLAHLPMTDEQRREFLIRHDNYYV